MDQAPRVCGVQCRAHLGGDRGRLARLEPPPLVEQRLEVGSVHVAHGQVELTVGLAGGEQRDHVRVVQPGRDPCLTLEPGPELDVAGKLRRPP
jgi:hypothetical protein